MARDQEQKQRLITEIKAYYNKLDQVREFGVKKHTSVWCMAATAHKFFLKARTVERYIYSY